MITLPKLVDSICRQTFLTFRGAQIAQPVFLAPCAIRGKPSLLKIGSNSFVGRAELQLHEKITIGENVIINDSARLLTGSHDINDPCFATVERPIKIGDYVWVATGAIILPGVTIGRAAVIAAGSVVTKDVGDLIVVAGSPAQPKGYREQVNFEYRPAKMTSAIEAWLGHGRCNGSRSQN